MVDLGAVPGYAATENAATPEPEPEAPEVIDTQVAWGAAVQPHPANVVTLSVPVSPAGLAVTDSRDTA